MTLQYISYSWTLRGFHCYAIYLLEILSIKNNKKSKSVFYEDSKAFLDKVLTFVLLWKGLLVKMLKVMNHC